MASFGRVLPAQALFVLLTVMSLRSRASPPLPSTPRLPRLPLSPNAFLRLPSRSRFMYLLPFPSPACLAAFLRVSPRGFYNWPSSSPPSRPFLPYILLFHIPLSLLLPPSSTSSSPLPPLPFCLHSSLLSHSSPFLLPPHPSPSPSSPLLSPFSFPTPSLCPSPRLSFSPFVPLTLGCDPTRPGPTRP